MTDPKRKLLSVLKVVVSLGLLAYLLTSIGLSGLMEHARPVAPAYLVLAVPAVFATIYLNGLSFYWVGRKYDLDLNAALRGSALSWAWGMVTPGRLGEFSIVHYLGKKGVPRGEVALAGLLIRVVSILILLCLALLSSTRLPVEGQGALLIAAFAVFAGSLAVFFWRIPLLQRFEKLLPTSLRQHLNIEDTFLKDEGLLFRITLTQIARILLMFMITKWMFALIGSLVDYTSIVFVNALTRVATMVPISFNGLGVREGIQVALFDRLYGIQPAEILSMGLWVNAMLYGCAASIWLTDMFRTRCQ